MNGRRVLLSLSCFVCLALSAGPVVILRTGAIEGNTDGIVDTFLGVPFGQATRFAPPRVFPAWSGIRNATAHGPPCAQIDGIRGSEDCLLVDVYRPAGGLRVNKTLVWLHGGAYFIGSASQYSGVSLAKLGAVVVIVQYRLGPLGFLPQAPNLGLMDQALALQWTHSNALAFGGSASRITVAGESAGGGSVLALLTSPAVPPGLVRGGAALSPGIGQQLPCSAVAQYGRTIMQLCNCTTLDCLQNAPVASVLAAYATLSQKVAPALPCTPCVDGQFLVAPIINRLDALPPRMMIGVTRDEGALFGWATALTAGGPLHDAPERVAPQFAAMDAFAGSNMTRMYPLSRGAWLQYSRMMGDYMIECLARRAMAKAASFRYVFDAWVPGNPIYFLGATHGQDLPFWFLISPSFDVGTLALANRMARKLLTFDDDNATNVAGVTVYTSGGDHVDNLAPESDTCRAWNDVFARTPHH